MHAINEITVDPIERTAIAAYLAKFEDEERGVEFWNARLRFWWEENPFCHQHSPKGWTLTSDGIIVGFMGLIPFEYVVRGEMIQAVGATTWRVDEEHRNASLPMFMKYHRLSQKYLVLDTTPNAEVRKILEKFNYRSEKTIYRTYFCTNANLSLHPIRVLCKSVSFVNSLRFASKNVKTVTLNDEFLINRNVSDPGTLQKNLTLPYLRWYCDPTKGGKNFIGCVDDKGFLMSYLIFREEKFRGMDAASVIDYFNVNDDRSEILALVGYLCKHPQLLPGKRDYGAIILNSYSPEFDELGKLIPCRKEAGKHYYLLPPVLAGVNKRCVLAEGDYGC